MRFSLCVLALLVSCAAGLQTAAGAGLRSPALATRARPSVMQFGNLFGGGSAPSRAAQGSPNPKDDAIAFKDPEALTPDEERKLKLEVGTNWRPRTSTVKGEGYQFFQGPSPKTSVQEGMPDFFSSDNFADSDAGAGKLFIPLAGVLTLGLAAVLASS